MNDLHRLKQARKLRLAEIQAKIETERQHLESVRRARTLCSRGNTLHNVQRLPQRVGTSDVTEFCRLAGPQWLWLDDSGVWNPFESHERDRIEHAFQLNKKTVPFLDGLHFLHTVDISNMTKVDMRTGYSRRVKRVPEYGFDNTFNTSRVDSNTGYIFDESLDSSDPYLVGDFNFLSLTPIVPKHVATDFTPRHFDGNSLGLIGNQFQTSLNDRSEFWSRHSDSSSRAYALSTKTKRKLDTNKGKVKSLKRVENTNQTSLNVANKGKGDANEYVPLRNWLRKFGLLKECFEKLKNEKVTLKELKQLTEEQMRSVGLPLGSCKRLVNAIKRDGQSRTIPNEFFCPITTTLMKDPVVASDGFTYEKEAVSKWLEDHDRSPLTNERLVNKELTPNRQLKKLIEDFGDGNVDL